MKRRIWISFLALPIYFYNAEINAVMSREVKSVINLFLSKNAFVSNSQNVQSKTISWQISARDEQTGECLRQRKCKD
ncbi:hypothetical protein NOS3756_09440 [Nostoc sp. NIES-3756]|uniref:hypothetical protein n=1 Tax=Nostoc sp. NIES-3756 TaxID=1751286 RepID=UPI00072261EF|nr:hypothetical protein [Nostoc sp. NIES-3756]BAT52013.1 hypothetical protein NOS3756_09440 [Nostoc sp. NIES-3756]